MTGGGGLTNRGASRCSGQKDETKRVGHGRGCRKVAGRWLEDLRW